MSHVTVCIDVVLDLYNSVAKVITNLHGQVLSAKFKQLF